MKSPSFVLALSLVTMSPAAFAQKSTTQPARSDRAAQVEAAGSVRPSDPLQSNNAQVMKTTRQALASIDDAQQAIRNNDAKKARAALHTADTQLQQLYKTPALFAIINEVDEAIASASQDKPSLQPMNLAPVAAELRQYQELVDPKISTDMESAKKAADQGDRKTAADKLTLVRDRLAMDVALLPVEEAYVRVLAAERALDNKDLKMAGRLLRDVPVVVAEVQVSRPLVPIRFQLSSAAAAIEAGNMSRAKQLVSQANDELQQVTKLPGDKQLESELTNVAKRVSQLNSQLQKSDSEHPQAKPTAQQVRQLAHDLRNLGESDQDTGQG